MEEELQAFLDHSTRLGSESWAGWTIHHLECAGQTCVAVRSGVGKVLASMVTQHLIDRFQPSVVVFYGDGQLRHWQRIIGAGTYQRPIPGKLIAHQRNGLQFFVTKHPACPGFRPSADDYFDEVGRFLHTHCPQCFTKPTDPRG